MNYPNIVFADPEHRHLLNRKDVDKAILRCESVAKGTKLKSNTAIGAINGFVKVTGVMKTIPVTFNGVEYPSLYKAMLNYSVSGYQPVVKTAKESTKAMSELFRLFLINEIKG